MKELFSTTGEKKDGSSVCDKRQQGWIRRSPKPAKHFWKYFPDFDIPLKPECRGFDSHKTIVKFFNWGRLIEKRLHGRMDAPKGSEFVLTSFVKELCQIHKTETTNVKAVEKSTHSHCSRDHHYLYVALRLCYVLDVSIKMIVSMLFREIFLCEGTLDAIFSIIPSSNTNSHMDLNVNTNKFTVYPGPRKQEKSAFRYFIRSICPLEKDIRECGENYFVPENVLNRSMENRFGDTPLQAAVIQSSPSIVLLLLRHGANPLLSKGGEFSPWQKCPVDYVLRMLSMMVWLRDRSGAEVEAQTAFCLQCLSYFARAVYVLDIRQSSGKVSTVVCQGRKQGVFEVHPRVALLLEAERVNYCPCPPPLTHVCRFTIRSALRMARRYNLPDAIRKLPVPQVIQNYLDLLC